MPENNTQRDQVDRLNVQAPNFTLQWKDMERYHSANGVLKYYPSGTYGRLQWALDPFGFVNFRGLVEVTDGFYAGRLFDLPREARPDYTAYVPCAGAAVAVNDPPVAGFLIVRSNGAVDCYINPTAGVRYIAITGCRYPILGNVIS